MKRTGEWETEDPALILAGMTFVKKWFGGVDETSVWEEIRRLNRAYQVCMSAKEERYREKIARCEEIIIRQQRELEQAAGRSPGAAERTGNGKDARGYY